MGLGGHLTWTAAAREITKRSKRPCLPVNGGQIVSSDIFLNNPNFVTEHTQNCFILDLGREETNYCISDTSEKAVHKKDKHIIQTICEYYGIPDPELKCDLFFTEEEIGKVSKLTSELPDIFLTIEPHSKQSYTVNRQYPWEKWQLVVDELKDHVPIVQIGAAGSKVLNSVIDFTGKTSFREAAALIGKSAMFLSNEGGLVHAATAVGTQSAIVICGHHSSEMVAYPQNITLNASTHGVCGMKKLCEHCHADFKRHDHMKLVMVIKGRLNERNSY